MQIILGTPLRWLLLVILLVITTSATDDKKQKIEQAVAAAEEEHKVTVVLPAPKVKRRSKLGINRGISIASSEAEALDHLSSGDDQTYFASFDATALSTAWVQLGGKLREAEESITAVEREKKKSELGYLPEQSSAYVSTDPKLARAADDDEDEAPAALQTLFEGRAPEFTEDEKHALTSQAQQFLAGQHTWQRMDPSNTFQHLRQPLPLVMWLTCDCPLDAHLARAMAIVQKTIRKRAWERLFHFTYIPALAQQHFDLASVYQLDAQLINIGPCHQHVCPSNSKIVRYTFPTPLRAAPQGLTVALHNECCGDKFSLSLADITAQGFTLTITRTDAGATGWGQPLKARWHARGQPWSPPGGVPALLLDNLPMGIHTEKYRWTPPTALWRTDASSVSKSATSVVKWLEGFLMGSLAPVIKSQPKPLVQAGPAPLVEVVASSFQEEVLAADSDALLFVYSPFCPASRAVGALLAQVVKKLNSKGGVTGLKIAKFDKTQNDIPITGIKVTRLPLLLLFPAGEGQDWLDYSDYNGSKQPHSALRPHSHFTVEMVLRFIYDHTRATQWGALGEEVAAMKPELYSDGHAHHALGGPDGHVHAHG